MHIMVQTECRGPTDILVGIAERWLRQKGYKTRAIKISTGTRRMGQAIGEPVDQHKWADQRVQKLFHPIATETERDDSGALQKTMIVARGSEDRPDVMITVLAGGVSQRTLDRPDAPQIMSYRYYYRSQWPGSQTEAYSRTGSFLDLPGYQEDEFKIRINEFLDKLPVQ